MAAVLERRVCEDRSHDEAGLLVSLVIVGVPLIAAGNKRVPKRDASTPELRVDAGGDGLRWILARSRTPPARGSATRRATWRARPAHDARPPLD
jgi:hypothetical protein